MRADASSPASWLSTVWFTAIVAVMSFCLGVGLLATWTAQPTNEDGWAEARERQQTIILWGSATGTAVATLFAGWAWRATARIRFHAAFFAGLALLVMTSAYIRHMQRYLYSLAEVWPPSPAGLEYLASPIIAIYSTSLAIILILAALYLDRS